jgi:hypothetical protein
MRFHLIASLLGCLAVLPACCGGGPPSPTCGPCSGDYDVENGGDLEEVSLCASITGDLGILDADWLASFDLPCLESVGGTLTISNNASLPSLMEVGTLSIQGDLTALDLPSLTNVGRLSIQGATLSTVCLLRPAIRPDGVVCP